MDWSEVQKAYQSGKSTSQLGKEFGLTQTGIAKGLRRMGTVMRPAKPYTSHSVDHTVFSSPLSDEAQYWLGFLITDGCVVYPKGGKFAPKISLELQARDRDHVQRFSDFLKSTYPLYFNKSANAWKVQVASQALADVLSVYGVVPKKTWTVMAPDGLIASRHFWRGVMDGDGYIGKAGTGQYELAGMSDLLLNQFRTYLIAQYGHAPAITKNGQGCHRVGSRKQQLLLDLYQPGDLALPRKAAIVEKLRERLDTEQVCDTTE